MSLAEVQDTTGPASLDEGQLTRLLERQREAALRHGAPSLAERRRSLDKLLRIVLDHREDVAAAISADFGNRSRHESLLAEIFTTANSIRHTRSHLKTWMKPRSAHVGWQFRPGRAKVMYQPLGVVGIIAPWNYPFQLTIMPLAGALAAGNRAIVKPSEFTPRTSELVARLIGQQFSEEEVAVVQGGTEVGEALARLPLDHLLYTGSTRVGHLVMRAASENLVPVTLELGGKSPAILGDFPLEKAAVSIATAKLLNAGQTCIAADYALVPEAGLDAFVAAMQKAMSQLYPTLADNPDYTTIINERHYRRLRGYVEEAAARGARVIEVNPGREALAPERRKIAPTLIVDPPDDTAVMQEEIFGPVLPVKTYRTLEEAIAYVNRRPRPLALYYFGNDRAGQEKVLQGTVSGGVTVNDTLTHLAIEDLPFGGVGASGMGAYHGFDGFANFSKKKGVFFQSRMNGSWMLRPPFGKTAEFMLKTLIGR